MMKAAAVLPNTHTYADAPCTAKGGGGPISADNSLVARALESRYNALIDACGKARQLTRAFDVLSMMKGGGVRPDAVSFTCLIDAVGHSLDQNGSMVALQKVFEMMREAGESALASADALTAVVPLVRPLFVRYFSTTI